MSGIKRFFWIGVCLLFVALPPTCGQPAAAQSLPTARPIDQAIAEVEAELKRLEADSDIAEELNLNPAVAWL
jgi:hypothetical protein